MRHLKHPVFFLITLAAASLPAASWENPPPAPVTSAAGPVVMPRTQVPRRVREALPAPARQSPALEPFYDLHSQHLDVDTRNLYAYGVTYIDETEFGPFGATDMIEAEFDFRLFRFEEFLFGRFEAWAGARVIGFIENPDIDALPDALLEASLDIGQTWRFVNGWSTEIRAAPGIYSDIAEPTFGIPLTLNFYYAVHPQLSLQLGGTFRPGWDIPVMPNVGLAWQPADFFRLEAMLPKSRVALFPGYMISLFGTFEWRNVTYGLTEEDNFPDALTLDDLRATAGVALTPFGDYTLTGEIGTYLQRELSADVESETAFDLSEETFFRVMVKGTF